MARAQSTEHETLTRAQFEMVLRRAGLFLPQAEYDNLYEGAAYIERLIGRLVEATEDDHDADAQAAGGAAQGRAP